MAINFIETCFIKKNTPELIKQLSDIGYKVFAANEYNWLQCSNGYVNDVEDIEDCIGQYCWTEELFLAIAAIRNDTDIHQYFYSNGAGYELMIYCPVDDMNEYLKTIDPNNYHEGALEKIHKATVQELLNFFDYTNG